MIREYGDGRVMDGWHADDESSHEYSPTRDGDMADGDKDVDNERSGTGRSIWRQHPIDNMT